MIAEELNGSHLGEKIAVKDTHVEIGGTLQGINHTAVLIQDNPIGQSPNFYPAAIGRRRVEMRLHNGTVTVRPEASVWVFKR